MRTKVAPCESHLGLEDDDLPDWDPEPSNADECPWIEEDKNFISIEYGSSSFDDTPFT